MPGGVTSHARRVVLALSAFLTFSLGASASWAQGAPPPPPSPDPSGAAPSWPTSPATAADPPLLPAPTPGAPTSTSGTDVTPPSNVPPPAPIVVKGTEDSLAKVRELEARVAADEERLKTLETNLGALRHLKFQGYVQLQYRVQSVNAAASPNLVNGSLPPGIGANDVIAKADGTTTNTNLFRLRRTRLRAIYETDDVRVFFQIDLLPMGGPTAAQGSIARNAEATGIAHWTKDIETRIGGGLFEVPFRNELLESSMYRPFIERTWASQNAFPTERDLGVHAKTFVMKDRFVFDVGILNGQRLGERSFVLLPDLNSSKDFFALVQTKLGPVTPTLYGYAGRGQTVDATLLRVKNFKKLGTNLAINVAHPFFPKLGETRVIGELMFATNMDTGVNYAFAVPAIPKVVTDDVKDLNERALTLRAEQELTKWGIAGFRYDTYTTDSDIANNARDTYTFMAGLRFGKNLRLMNEASYAVDNMHPEGAVAPSKHIYGYTAWLQGGFY